MNLQARATPRVQSMQVIPVAGHDSMLLNLCGAHAPYFTRNLVLLTDDSGNTGIGEVPGGEGIRQALERCRPLVIDQPIGLYNRTLNRLRNAVAGNAAGTPQATRHEVTSEAEAAVLRQPHEINLRLDNVITAVEAALLDLLGDTAPSTAPEIAEAEPDFSGGTEPTTSSVDSVVEKPSPSDSTA